MASFCSVCGMEKPERGGCETCNENVPKGDPNDDVSEIQEVEEQSIELDCAPGGIRPGDLIEGVMAGAAVEYDGRSPASMFMGNWKWYFQDIPADKWLEAQPTFRERIIALHNNNTIRYGSW